MKGDSVSLWKDYYVLLVSRDYPLDKAHRQLEQAFADGDVLSLENCTVQVSTFSGLRELREISLKELDRFLDPADPRRDSYMTELQGYFSINEGYHHFYLRTSLHPLEIYFRTLFLKWTEGFDFLFPGIDIVEKGGIVILFFLFTGIFLFDKRKWRLTPLLAALALAWGKWLLWGSFYHMLIFLLVYPLFACLIKEALGGLENYFFYKWKKNFPEKIVFYGLNYLAALVVMGILMVSREGISLPPIFSTLFLSCGYMAVKLVHQKKRSRPVIRFTHMGRYRKIKVKNLAYLILFLLVITFIPFYYLLKSSDNDILIPMGDTYSAGSFRDPAVFKAAGKQNKVLPDLSDYIKHIYYQQSLAYGGQYGFEGELRISKYRKDDVEIIKQYITPLTLDDKWLKKVFEQVGQNSVESMLIAQERPVIISFKQPGQIFKEKYPIGKNWIFPVIFITVIFIYFYWTPVLLYGIRNLLARRRHKVA